ncbi:hypothetical protein Pint_34010 [Pistacia integerrima]|uniref:Uncharacterized protein n=1 Tax=Pistacia integerrima TaxID=434235 RepID=A0ACC0X4Z1_9ROSI|nr:hypothetical protein Pint_34010 [Pistacia integerrima]
MATTAPARPFSTHLHSLSSRNFLNGTGFTHHQESKNKTKNTTTLPLKSTSFQPIAALPFDLSPPPIDHDLLDKVKSAGAEVSENGIVETFGNDDEALDAVDNGVAAVDLSHFGRIRGTFFPGTLAIHSVEMIVFSYFTIKTLQILKIFEKDFHMGLIDGIYSIEIRRDVTLFLLHQQLGQYILLTLGSCFVNSLGFLWHSQKNSIMLVVSPLTCGSISDMLNKFIFFADKVEIQDITKQTSLFILLGPKSNTVSNEQFESQCVRVNELFFPFQVNGILLSLGTILMGSNAWEKLRVIQGRPTPGKELTNEFNVLEAGCYKGQETISRLITYDGVKQRLWGICLSEPVEPGSAIMVDGKKVGKLTEEKSLIILV